MPPGVSLKRHKRKSLALFLPQFWNKVRQRRLPLFARCLGASESFIATMTQAVERKQGQRWDDSEKIPKQQPITSMVILKPSGTPTPPVTSDWMTKVV